MDNLTIQQRQQLWRERYDDLTTWDRIDLERYALAFNLSTLVGATKIMLIRAILLTEMDGWPQS